jgi:thiazole synthase
MKPILCLVTDRSAASGDLVEWVAAAVGAGVDWVQIRERELDGAALFEHAQAKEPEKMARAMKLAVEAGRLAYEAGRMPKRLYASASSPLDDMASF